MSHTFYFDDHTELVPHLAQGYFPGEDGAIGRARSRADLGAAGGVVSTVGDLALFDKNLYDNQLDGGDEGLILEFLGPGRFDDGSLIQAHYDFGPKQNYGFGISSGIYRGAAFFQHGGLIDGYTSSYYHFPDNGLGFSVLCNSNANVAILLLQQMLDLFLEEPKSAPTQASLEDPQPSKPIELSEPELARFAGVFTNDKAILNPLHIRFEGGALKLDVYEFMINLDVVGAQQLLTSPEFPMSLTVTYDGPPGSRRIQVEGTFFVDQYTYDEEPPFARSAEDIESLVGDYYSRELDVTYRFFYKNDELQYRVDSGPAARTDWPARNLIRLSSIRRATLVRGDDDEITGFRLSVQRAQGVRFRRVAFTRRD